MCAVEHNKLILCVHHYTSIAYVVKMENIVALVTPVYICSKLQI